MKKMKVIIIFSICLIYGILINTYYRPFIYTNKINDHGLADIGNNIAFVPAVYLLGLLKLKKYYVSRYYDIMIF
jgi:hypothetical protein